MLRRGLPFSLGLHFAVLTVLILFGNQVARHPVRPPHAMKVKMVHLPSPSPVKQPPQVLVKPPVAQSRIREPQPAKELPKPKPKPKPEPKVVKPQPKVEAAAPSVVPETAEIAQIVPAVVSAPSVKGTDEDFPFSWYINLVESKVVNNWHPRKLGFGKRAVVSCTVHFRVARNGAVTEVTLNRNSGVGVYDRESLRAVKSTRLPPLPPQYRGSSLGITFIFHLEPSH